MRLIAKYLIYPAMATAAMLIFIVCASVAVFEAAFTAKAS